MILLSISMLFGFIHIFAAAYVTIKILNLPIYETER